MSLAQSLIESGYFPKMPPAFSTLGYSAVLDLPARLDSIGKKWSRCISTQSTSSPMGRLLGIPNPLHQYKLALAIEKPLD